MKTSTNELLKIEDLKISFPLGRGRPLVAVDGIELSVSPGEAVGLIGESGSGKSVTALAALGLLSGSAKVTGNLTWCGQNLLRLTGREWRRVRGAGMTMLFQDAIGSLNPALRVGSQLVSVIRLQQNLPLDAAQVEARRLLLAVRLPDTERILSAYPHECSGGIAQRVALAMALACRPRLLIADEPTSALDVTVAAQIISLLKQVQVEFGLALLVITHDLGVVARLCDRLSVMYLGKIVETGPVRSVIDAPRHPYTSELLEAAKWHASARPPPLVSNVIGAPGIPAGCRFHPRCPSAFEPCTTKEPSLNKRVATGHYSACWLYD